MCGFYHSGIIPGACRPSAQQFSQSRRRYSCVEVFSHADDPLVPPVDRRRDSRGSPGRRPIRRCLERVAPPPPEAGPPARRRESNASNSGSKPPASSKRADRDADPTEPTIDIYLPPPDKATGMAMMVLPGGGYTNLAIGKEGTAFANLLISHNIAAFVVRYRHAPRYHNPYPLMDAQRAIRTVRSKAAEYHVDPCFGIGMIGFSAGGHLAAWSATAYDNGPALDRPDAIDGKSCPPRFRRSRLPRHEHDRRCRHP